MSLKIHKSVGYGVILPTAEAKIRVPKKLSLDTAGFLDYVKTVSEQDEAAYRLSDVVSHLALWKSVAVNL
jgi:hypothetical protein